MLILKEKNWLITEETELGTVMSTFCVNIAELLDIKKDNDSPLNSITHQNINDALEEYKNHSSVDKIRQTFMTGKLWNCQRRYSKGKNYELR